MDDIDGYIDYSEGSSAGEHDDTLPPTEGLQINTNAKTSFDRIESIRKSLAYIEKGAEDIDPVAKQSFQKAREMLKRPEYASGVSDYDVAKELGIDPYVAREHLNIMNLVANIFDTHFESGKLVYAPSKDYLEYINKK